MSTKTVPEVEQWHQGGDYVLDENNKCVAATSSAGAYVQANNWAQISATVASDQLAKDISALPEMVVACQKLAEWDQSHDNSTLISEACSLARAALLKMRRS